MLSDILRSALTGDTVAQLERIQQQHTQIIDRLKDLAREQGHLVNAQAYVAAASQDIRIGVQKIISREEQALQGARIILFT
jgi:hypothetical protein